MKNTILIFIFLFSLQSASENYGSIVVSELGRVYDGDSFIVTIVSWPPIVGKNVWVRVAGVDTPEIRGKCEYEKKLAKEAKRHTTRFLKSGKIIELKNLQRGKYFRVVAEVYVDGKSLSDSLINANLAYLYEGKEKQPWC